MPIPLVTRILVADDHEIVRRGLKLVMEREPDLEVVAEAADGADRSRDIEATKQSVRQALEEVRRIARELRPELLEHLGLVSALIELSRKFAQQSGIRVERRFADPLPPLSDEAEIAVYRVAQESLTNVARHADASRVEIALQPGIDSVVLRVVDDGRGLPEPPASLNGHAGLRGMRERALLVGGRLAVFSAPGEGTTVEVTMGVT